MLYVFVTLFIFLDNLSGAIQQLIRNKFRKKKSLEYVEMTEKHILKCTESNATKIFEVKNEPNGNNL